VLRSKRLGWWNKLLALCELTIPPMGAVAVFYMAVAAVDLFVLFGMTPGPGAAVRAVLLGCIGLMTAALAAYAISPFLAMRLDGKYALCIVFFPFYVGWKFWITLKGRPDRWVRTQRAPARGDAHQRTDGASFPR
jgi:hypothetical protein